VFLFFPRHRSSFNNPKQYKVNRLLVSDVGNHKDAPKVYKPRARSLLDDGLFRPTVAEAGLVYKTMG
ncbi:hypothetical protein, partial [Burkholderia ubonensis]|uniref:hypothetical protein n=1 Tax=Burkholderia ubonensis TaxID=101571 RepID=UPI001E503807